MRPFVRGAAALLAVPALSLSALVATSTPASAAGAIESAQASGANEWLSGQLTGGLVHNGQYDFDDVGLTIDVAIAADALGDDATVASIAAAVAKPKVLAGYVGDGATESYAGALGKTVVLAQEAGKDPTAFGGVDLLDRLEARLVTSGAGIGRIEDASQYGDYAGTISQAYAVHALAVAGSPDAEPTIDFLLDQQCSDGYFRQITFSDDSVDLDQTCDQAGGTADVDATALAAWALQPEVGDSEAASDAWTAAVDWLASVQASDGSFGSGDGSTTPNTNSTGLAARVLAMSGSHNTEATAAADWIADLQVTDPGSCTGLGKQVGAVAFDADGYAAGEDAGITTATSDQWRRATAQAAFALPYLSDPAAVTSISATAPTGYLRGGSNARIAVSGLAGADACVIGPGGSAAVEGGTASVTLPTKTGTYTYRVLRLGEHASVQIKALGATKLQVSVKKKAKVGTRQTIKVTGLAPSESVSAKVTWPKRKNSSSGSGWGGDANRKGVFTATVKVPNRPGTAKVKVVGAFANRTGSTSFTVTK